MSNMNWEKYLIEYCVGTKRFLLHEDMERTGECKKQINSCAICRSYFEPNTRIASYKSHHYHENCFVCMECRCTLSDTPFVVQNPKEFDSSQPNIMCDKCFQKKSPKCNGCELPFEPNAKMLVINEIKHFHPDCFKCDKCQSKLDSDTYYAATEDSTGDGIRCSSCFEKENPGVTPASSEYLDKQCAGCSNQFSPGIMISAYKDKHYHRECFKCSKCDQPIIEHSGFFPQDEDIWCTECYRKNGPKCPSCNKPFDTDDEVLEYDNKEYHADCFKCDRCQFVIGSGPFYLTDGQICCKKCF